MTFDVLIKNGSLADGTGSPLAAADVGIEGDKITFVGRADPEDTSAARVIDAAGRLVAPGFIDSHSHADCSVFMYPNCDSYLRQGITTFIGGQCGDSNAPINNWWMRKYWEYDLWNDIDPFIYSARSIQPVKRVVDVVREKWGYDITWHSFCEYADVVEKLGLGCNMITLAGHSQIRADVMGLDEHRRPSAEEMAAMKRHIDEAFEAGVWGISTGRDYPPSAYADFDEITELAEHSKKNGGYYFTHWRRTGVRSGTPARPNKLEGITEPLELGLKTGIKVQISHLASGFEIFPPSAEMDRYAAELTLRHIDSYIARGVDVAFDVIPGTSGGICTTPYLASRFIPWVKQSGSLANFITNLKAYDYRERLFSTLAEGRWYTINPRADSSWDSKIYITQGIDRYVGMNIRQIAGERGRDSLNTVFDLLLECPMIGTMSIAKSDEEIKGLLRHERGYVCSDTYATDLRGMYGNDAELPELYLHPHTFCVFPKYIKKYAEGSIESVIRKLTGAPAGTFGIKGRGVIKEGSFADILVIDMENLSANENYIEPRVFPTGIDYVLVNGRIAVDKKGCTFCKSGRLLKK